MELVLKTSDGVKPTVSSNLTLSANACRERSSCRRFSYLRYCLYRGSLIITNPFSSPALLRTFAGVSLQAEAVADLVIYFFSRRD